MKQRKTYRIWRRCLCMLIEDSFGSRYGNTIQYKNVIQSLQVIILASDASSVTSPTTALNLSSLLTTLAKRGGIVANAASSSMLRFALPAYTFDKGQPLSTSAHFLAYDVSQSDQCPILGFAIYISGRYDLGAFSVSIPSKVGRRTDQLGQSYGKIDSSRWCALDNKTRITCAKGMNTSRPALNTNNLLEDNRSERHPMCLDERGVRRLQQRLEQLELRTW